MTSYKDYFNYLKNRSKLGLIYRKFWLYPRINRHISGKTLDIGCGLGDFLRYRPNTIGVDVNPNIVAWCQEQGLPAQIMSESQLPFDDGAFDSVVLDNVLEHIVDPDVLLTEVKRVLKSGGKFLIGVPGSKGYASDSDHKVFYTEDQLVHKLKQFGFVKTRVFSMPFELSLLSQYISQYCIYCTFENR